MTPRVTDLVRWKAWEKHPSILYRWSGRTLILWCTECGRKTRRYSRADPNIWMEFQVGYHLYGGGHWGWGKA